MKKKLLALMSMILACLMLFAFVSCGGDEDSDDEGGNEDGVAIGDAISEMVKATLAEDGIKATIKLDATIPEGGDMSADCVIYVQKEANGEYNFKITYDASMDGDNEKGEMIIKDGKGYMIESGSKPYYSFEDLYADINDELGTDDFIFSLDYIIELANASITEEISAMLKQYKIEISKDGIANIVKRVVNAVTLNATFTEVDGGYEIAYSVDYKDMMNETLAYVATLSTDTKLDAIINKAFEIAGIDMTADKMADILKNALKDDMTVAEAVAALETAIKELSGVEVSLKAIVDEMQTDLDISTQQIIDLVKMATGGDMDGQLRDAKSGETAYDYLMSKFGEIVLSEEMIGIKLSELGASVEFIISSQTLGDALVMFGAATEEDLEAIDEQFAQFSAISVDKYDQSFKFRLDSKYRIEEISVSMNMKMSMNGQVMMDMSESMSVKMEYTSVADSTFAVPDNFLDVENSWVEIGYNGVDEWGDYREYDMTPDQFFANGFTTDLIMGSKASVKEIKLEMYGEEIEMIDGIKVENGKLIVSSEAAKALSETGDNFEVIVVAADNAEVNVYFDINLYVEGK